MEVSSLREVKMSEAFFCTNLMRCKQIKQGLVPIREPAFKLPHAHFPLIGKVENQDIHIAYTLLCMAIDVSEHHSGTAHQMRDQHGSTYLWHREYMQAQVARGEVEVLSAQLQIKLCQYFKLVYEDTEGFIVLYEGWYASWYRPDQFVIPIQFAHLEGHA